VVSWGFGQGCPAANNTLFPNVPVNGFGVLTNIQTFYSYIVSILGDSVWVNRVGFPSHAAVRMQCLLVRAPALLRSTVWGIGRQCFGQLIA
jgi:hypothetical protein